MNLFRPKKTIVVHSGRFHADDVFSIALLRMLPEWKHAKLVRTRDEAIILAADMVVDVGGVYKPSKNRFDHHQTGGAGKYENGIPYSSFGLVWKEFGLKLSGSEEVFKIVSLKLVQPIDAIDNGFSIGPSIVPGISEYVLDELVDAFNPSWKEEDYDRDAAFEEIVSFAQRVLGREIKKAKDKVFAWEIVEDFYQKSADKRIIVFPRHYPFQDVLIRHPEPIFAVFPHTVPGTWAVRTVSAGESGFENRKDLPKAWAGKRDEDIAKLTGVPDAFFCHNGLWIATARSKEGAIKLAELALGQ